MRPRRDREEGRSAGETGADEPRSEGSIEATLEGRFELDPLRIIAEAFRLTSGFKTVALIGAVFLLAVTFAGEMLGRVLFLQDPDALGELELVAASAAAAALQNVLSAVPLAGLAWVGLRHLAGQPVQAGQLLTPLARLGPILVMALLQWLLIMFGFLLLIVPGIYLSVAYTLSLPALIDRSFTPWQALEASREVVTKCWFRMLLLMLLLVVMLAFSAVLIVPLVWTVPAAVLAWVIAYRNLCGIAAAARARR